MDAITDWLYWPKERYDAFGWKDKDIINIEKMVDAMTVLYQEKPTIWLSTNKKENIMNQENYQYVADQVKYGGGFGDSMLAGIKSNFEKGVEKSSMVFTKSHGKDVTAVSTLNFSKLKNGDLQFWNNYQMTAKFANGSERSQLFKIDSKFHKNIITENEAFKLVSGAAFLKEYMNEDRSLEKKWAVLDEDDKSGKKPVLVFGKEHGYDLRKMLMRRPIKDKKNPRVIENIARAMESGLVGKATYVVNGAEEQMQLVAQPRYKSIIEIDSTGNKISFQQNVLDSPAVSTNGQDQRESGGKTAKKDDGDSSPSSKAVNRGGRIKEPTVKEKKPRNAKKHGI